MTTLGYLVAGEIFKDYRPMKVSIKIMACALVMGLLLVGCTYQRKVYLKRTDFPEHIYRTSTPGDYTDSSVAVFNFREPPYANGMGNVASESLCEVLLNREVFTSVTHEADVSDLRIDTLMEIARNNDYDLIIAGDILYYFEGGLHQASRVDQRIRVIDVHNNATLWFAKAVDIGPSAPYTDGAFLRGRGAPAPATRTLFKRNAEKFCKMLLTPPSQALLPTTASDQEPSAEDHPLEVGKESYTEGRFLEIPLGDNEEYSAPRKPAETKP